MLKITTFALIFTAAMLAGCANTSQQRITPDEPLAVSVEEFRAEMRELQANLSAGSPRELKESEWREFNRIQRGFDLALANVETVNELSINDRLKVYNLQEDLAVLLGDAGATNDNLYCTRHRRTGTNMVTTTCVTREELTRQRESSRRGVDQYMQRDRGRPPEG